MRIKYLSLFLFLSFLAPEVTFAQFAITGIWETIDDKDGQPSSHIMIYEVNDKIHGKIVKLINEPDTVLCDKCKGDKKDKPILGMEIIWNMKKDKENEWKSGKIMDPDNGKEYKCKMKIVEENVLKVRGFVGFSLLGRTQKWYRVLE